MFQNPEHISTIIQRVVEGIMEHKLCEKCEKTLGIAMYEGCHHPSWWHCHHDDSEIDYQKPWRGAAEKMVKWAENHYWDSLEKDKDLIVKHIKDHFYPEPPEKPKEKCVWCADGERMEDHVKRWWDFLFCPHCGRRL